MSPSAAQRLEISLANEIAVASSAFDAYLIISAVVVFVRTRGSSSGKTGVQLLEHIRHALVDPAQNDSVGEHEVGDRLALGEELRVDADPEVVARLLARGLFEERQNDIAGRIRHDRALDDDGVVPALLAEREADFARGLAHGSEVDLRAVERRADCDQRDVRIDDRRPQVARRVKRLTEVAAQKLVETRLDDRGDAAANRREPCSRRRRRRRPLPLSRQGRRP